MTQSNSEEYSEAQEEIGSEKEQFDDSTSTSLSEDFIAVETPLTDEEKQSLKDSLLTSRENTRSKLATSLIVLLGITVAFIQISSLAILMFPGPSDSNIESGEMFEKRFNYSKDIASVLLSTQTGLVGAVIGFYFGSKES